MNPEISIIVPVYNLELYLERCIKSILEQTFTNFEVILVNDGSTDKSSDICEYYASMDKRINVINKKYGGVSSARNIGLKAARGEYIGFVDGDDWIFKDMYQKLHDICIGNGCEIAICNLYREIDGQIQYIERTEFIKVMCNKEALKQLFKGNLYRFALWNKLYKKSCFKDIGFPEDRIHEDLSTTYKLFANANKVVYTNYTGYVYVKRANSILNTKYNVKRFDAFIGWDEIMPYMKGNYPEIFHEVTACFVYWCTDNMYYILNQVGKKEERNQYLQKIQIYIRKYYKCFMQNELISLKYKNVITLLNYNIYLIVVTNKIKKFISGKKVK